MSSRIEVKLRIPVSVGFVLLLLLAADAARAQRSGPADPATIPTPTGMLYHGGLIEMRPNGQWGLADYPIVSRVDSGSVSARAGFKLGDVLLTVNGRDVRDARPFRLQRGEEHWVVRVRRGTEEMELTMEVPPSMRRGRAPSAAPPR
jgi:S1-C subfamily serine protease